MKKAEIKTLRNHFELQAMYTRQFMDGYISKEEFLKNITLLSQNTVTILNIK